MKMMMKMILSRVRVSVKTMKMMMMTRVILSRVRVNVKTMKVMKMILSRVKVRVKTMKVMKIMILSRVRVSVKTMKMMKMILSRVKMSVKTMKVMKMIWYWAVVTHRFFAAGSRRDWKHGLERNVRERDTESQHWASVCLRQRQRHTHSFRTAEDPRSSWRPRQTLQTQTNIHH